MPESAEITRATERGLMRVSDMAAFLGISRQRVDQLAELGRLPRTRSIKGHRMWERSEVEEWADHYWWGARPWRIKLEG